MYRCWCQGIMPVCVCVCAEGHSCFVCSQCLCILCRGVKLECVTCCGLHCLCVRTLAFVTVIMLDERRDTVFLQSQCVAAMQSDALFL